MNRIPNRFSITRAIHGIQPSLSQAVRRRPQLQLAQQLLLLLRRQIRAGAGTSIDVITHAINRLRTLPNPG